MRHAPCADRRRGQAGRQHQGHAIPDSAPDSARLVGHDTGGASTVAHKHTTSPSHGFTIIQEGDLILTGTPSGVGPVAPGEKVECTLKDASGKVLATLDFAAVQREGGYSYVPK